MLKNITIEYTTRLIEPNTIRYDANRNKISQTET